MKKFYLIPSVIVVALLASACGGGAPPQPASPQPAATLAQPTAAAPTAAPGAAAGQPDIPLMADAAEVTTAVSGGETAITYKSASALDTVITFYQTEMPPRGWNYRAQDTTIISGVSAVLYFSKAGEEAAVTLTHMGGVTMAAIAIQGGGTSQLPAAAPTVAPGAAAGQPDIPLMADAAEVTTAVSGGETAITYKSASALDTVITFYQTEMPPRGWNYRAQDTTIVSGVSAVLYFSKAGEEAAVTLTHMGGVTMAAIAIQGGGTSQLPAAAPTALSQVSPTTPPQVPPTAPPAAGRSDIPQMTDATEVEINTSGGDYALTYKSASALDTITTFYQTEMPPRGWTYLAGDSSIIPGVNAVLYFTKAGEEATVTLTNMGGIIFVEVVVN